MQQQSMTGVKDQLKIKVSIIPSESESHYNFLGSSVCSHFFEKRRKIGSFSGNIHLKISAFYDSRSHCGWHYNDLGSREAAGTFFENGLKMG